MWIASMLLKSPQRDPTLPIARAQTWELYLLATRHAALLTRTPKTHAVQMHGCTIT